ncbi:MAG: hypothetical protein EON61_01550 [Alphaproteobacteria bacterium]|nr:MAG: hypothetical protein EON61_01550 [Alphaproteobacteria bacterium]
MSETSQAAQLKAKAISRWEGEGGALGSSPASLDQDDMRILARLGAALLIQRAGIPDERLEEVFDRASSLHAERDAARIKQEIAQLLNKREDR